MLKLKLLSFLIISPYLVIMAQNWSFLTVGSGVKPSIAVDQFDQPHIGFMLEALPGFVSHAVLRDGEFVVTEIDQAYYYGPLDIAIDQTGNPYIVLHNHDDEDENLYQLDDLGQWNRTRIGDEGHDGWDNSLDFDSNDYPHTSSVDPSQFGSSDGVEYSWYDGSRWHKESIGSGPVQYQFSTCIRLDEIDQPHITYYDNRSNSLKYALKSNGSWNIVTVADDGGMFSSMVLDQDGRPHIAFYHQTDGNRGQVKYAQKEGDSWNIETVDELTNVPITFTGARNVTSLDIDAQGALHLSYGDRDLIKYATRRDGLWTIETVLDESGTNTLLGAQTSLAVDADGNPHITYFEATGFSPLQGVVKYTTKQNSTSTAGPGIITAGLRLFPNPAPGAFWLQLDEEEPDQADLLIRDLRGRIVYEHLKLTLHPKVFFNLKSLSTGVYLIQLRTSRETITRKLLIAK